MFGIDDAALGILIASGVSTAGQLYANSKNQKNQNALNQQNMAIAAMNNATQIDMANSAHQREVADLRKAGLNPILSAGGSGSATPTLTAPNLGVSHVENPVQHATESAGQLSRVISANARADVAQKIATTSNLQEQNYNLQAQNGLLKAQEEKTRAETEQIRHPVTRGVRDVVNSIEDLNNSSSGLPLSKDHHVVQDTMAKELQSGHAVPVNSPHSAKAYGDGKTVYDQLLEREHRKAERDGMILHLSDTPEFKKKYGKHSIFTR